MATYKVDMVATLEHIASERGVPTSYDDLTPEARGKRSTTANRARSRKRALGHDDAEGPPDKHHDFKKGNAHYIIILVSLLHTCTFVLRSQNSSK